MRVVIILCLSCILVDAGSILNRLEEEKQKVDDGDRANEIHMDRLKMEEVVPQDHIFGVKMERDGDENKNYHKEVFLGKEMEKFGNGDYRPNEKQRKLKEIFNAVDVNSDGFLDETELTDWVLTKTREHFYEARMNNENVVEKLDVDGDDEISWNEFLAHYLSENGMGDKKEFLTRFDAGENWETLKLSTELESKVFDLKMKWLQFQDVGKKSLSLTQFFSFQHPETSNESLKFFVEDILHDMDTDDSNDITIQEYVAMPPNADVDTSQDIWVIERRKEFRNVIDRDQDGKVTIPELEAYLDPLSRNMAAQEARKLIGLGDEDEDGRLTLEEILENSEFYTGSKLYNYAKSVHEEF